MKVIKFDNGKYGIRFGLALFGFRYQDFKNKECRWRVGSGCFNDCQTDISKIKTFISEHYPKTEKIIDPKDLK